MSKIIKKGETRREWAYEEQLRKFGLGWEQYLMARSDLDVGASRWNLARSVEPINEKTAADYTRMVAMGDTLSMPVVIAKDARVWTMRREWRDKKGSKGWKRFMLLGGNHTDEAFSRNHYTHYTVYLVDPRDVEEQLIFEVFPKALNLLHGLKIEEDDRLSTAVSMVRNKVYTVEEAARVFRTTAEAIRRRIEHEEVAQNLIGAGVDRKAVREFKTNLHPFAKITLVPVQQAAGALAVNLDFSIDESWRFVNEIISKPAANTEAGMMAVIEAYRKKYSKECSSRSQHRKESTDAQLSWRYAFALNKHIGNRTKISEFGFDSEPNERDRAMGLFKELNRKLCAVIASSTAEHLRTK